MIFTKKDLRDARSAMESPGTRIYWIKDPMLLHINCFGQKIKGRFIRWWNCKAYSPKGDVPIFEFAVHQPKWNDKWFLEALDKAMQEGGKHKLIVAIYNDFAA